MEEGPILSKWTPVVLLLIPGQTDGHDLMAKVKKKKSNLLNNLEKYPLSEAAVKMAEIRRQFLLPLKIAFDGCVCV